MAATVFSQQNERKKEKRKKKNTNKTKQQKQTNKQANKTKQKNKKSQMQVKNSNDQHVGKLHLPVTLQNKRFNVRYTFMNSHKHQFRRFMELFAGSSDNNITVRLGIR